MKTDTAVFVTDSINRQNMMLPLSTLVESMERLLVTAIERNMPNGMPANTNLTLAAQLAGASREAFT